MTDAIIKGILVGLFMAISVGPTLFAVIKYSLNYSYKSALAFVFGVSISDIIYVVLANIAASWLEYLRPYERHIAFGGAVALMAIGLIGLLKKIKPTRPSIGPAVIPGGHYLKIWISGFLVNTLNPGVFITWLGAVTIIGNKSGGYRFVLFTTCLIIILGIDFLKIFLAERIKRLLTTRRIIYMQRFSSACIFLIGLSLFITTVLNIRSSENGKKSEIDKILSVRQLKTEGSFTLNPNCISYSGIEIPNAQLQIT
ncbi:MAG: lysine transporter LysE [Flavipsychrobacter sp.]|nr:lysine transporter LysE [Flavipsychrobacter sp.]